MQSKPGAQRAARRVANYLRAQGLSDPGRLRTLSQEIAVQVVARDVAGKDDGEHAARAVAAAQSRFEAWRSALYAALPEGVDPLWLRAFIGARPELFLGDVERAQQAATGFGDPLAGKGPRRARFRPQQFEPAHVPRWLVGLAPPLLLTWGAAFALWRAVAANGWTWLELGWVSLFAFLFFLAAIGFSTAVIGYATRRQKRPTSAPEEQEASAPTERGGPRERPVIALPAREAARTALLMPIYHESAEDVFAALAGMRESLAAASDDLAFEIFVLSDSRDPAICADEERAFRNVAAAGDAIPIYYHRRAHNERQKAGNLAEFFERWGPRYKYAVTLDADSIMSSALLCELVHRMDRAPETALIQTPLTLHRGETWFARALQFSSSVCGPVFTRGLSIWSGAQGNYYGHNAILRVSAFLDCCALPKLNGEPPFGGHVLSHDFVEAALLCRAGWEVHIAHDLTSGSYEGLPPTVTEYVARDHRWCQGNLQHLRIAGMRGLAMMSRIHLLLGAFAYLAAPAWLLFMLAGVLLWRHTGAAFEGVAALVGVSTLVVLVAPWCLGLMDCMADPVRRRAHGGGVRLLISTLSGLALGSVLAPVLMLHHTRIVVSILTGHAVGWGVQQRRASGSFAQIVRAELPSTALGIGVALWSAFDQAGLFLWLAPLWLPWSLAMPINFVVSSTRVGHWLRRWGLLSVPSELEPEDLLRRIDELAVLTRSDATARFRDLVLDPVLVTAHIAKLGDERSRQSPRRLAELRGRVLSGGPSSLSTREWRSLAGDAESMQILHREAWQHWPVESWDLGREDPQVPPETSRPALAATEPRPLAPAPRSAPVALSSRAASPASQRDR